MLHDSSVELCLVTLAAELMAELLGEREFFVFTRDSGYRHAHVDCAALGSHNGRAETLV